MSRAASSTVLKIGLAILVAAGATAYVAGFWPFGGRIEHSAAEQGRALIGGPFTLTDHTGRRVTEADFAGRATLIYFGYSYCPDMCPMGLATMAAAYDQLPPAVQERLVPIFVTVDPERDTVEALASYVALFHPAMVGLTGSIAETDTAAKAWRVYYAKAKTDAAADYLVDHSTFTYLMDGGNSYLAHFGHDTTPEAMAETILTHLEAAGIS